MARKGQAERAVEEEEVSFDAVAGAAIVAKFPRQLIPFSPGVRRWHEDLRNLVSDISTATELVRLGETWLKKNYALIDTFCSHLSPTLKEYLNSDYAQNSADMVEMICVTVEFVMGVTSCLVGKDHAKLHLFLKLVQTIQVIFDMKNVYYKMRGEKGNQLQIVLNNWRLWEAERVVCGLYFRSADSSDPEFHPTGCRNNRRFDGVRVNEACSACIEASSHDGVVTYIRWQLGMNLYGYIYLWLLDVLKSFPEDDTFQDLDNLLRPNLLVDSERLLRWLNTEDIILKLLKADYKRDDLAKVIEFVATIRKKGLIHEPVVQNLFKFDILQTEEQIFVHESIVASVLDSSNLSSFSTEFLEIIIGWLEQCKVATPSSAIGQRLSSVFKKLPFCDMERKHERRLLDLFWRHMVLGRSQEFTLSGDFIDFMTNFAGHYVLANDVAPHSEDVAKLLQSCFSAEHTSLYKLSSQEPDHVDAFVQEAKRWETIEHSYLGQIPSQKQLFQKLLDFEISLKRQEILKDCMQWLSTARNLTTEVDNFSSEALGSARDSILLPVMRILEALKNESSIHSQAGKKFEDLSAQHLREYANLRSSYCRSIETFLERCLSEKADVVKEALYSTAKVVAYKERARVSVSDEVFSHDALKRMLQNVEPLISSVKKGKRKMSESECAICYEAFGQSRKRACLGPCGHAQACLQCANREYDRTKACPICQGCIEKPIPLNSKVFF